MNLWTMLGTVILLYGVVALVLVANMRVDRKTPWKGLVRGAQDPGKQCTFIYVVRVSFFVFLGVGLSGRSGTIE